MSNILPSPIPDLEHGGTTCPAADGLGVGELYKGGLTLLSNLLFGVAAANTYSFIRTLTDSHTFATGDSIANWLPNFTFYIGGCPKTVRVAIDLDQTDGYTNGLANYRVNKNGVNVLIMSATPTWIDVPLGIGSWTASDYIDIVHTGPCPTLVEIFTGSGGGASAGSVTNYPAFGDPPINPDVSFTLTITP